MRQHLFLKQPCVHAPTHIGQITHQCHTLGQNHRSQNRMSFSLTRKLAQRALVPVWSVARLFQSRQTDTEKDSLKTEKELQIVLTTTT